MIYIRKMDIMETTMQVSKWGNSLAVRLPKALVDELVLKEGCELNLVAAGNGAIEGETRQARRKAALERMAARNWTLPPDYKFDRDQANERGAPSSTPTFSSPPSKPAGRATRHARGSRAVASSACRC